MREISSKYYNSDCLIFSGTIATEAQLAVKTTCCTTSPPLPISDWSTGWATALPSVSCMDSIPGASRRRAQGQALGAHARVPVVALLALQRPLLRCARPGGEFNAANMNIPVPGAFFGGDNLRSGVRDYRYQGSFLGAGATYGYQWILSRHWNIEAEVGVGYAHVWVRQICLRRVWRAPGRRRHQLLRHHQARHIIPLPLLTLRLPPTL